MADYSYGNPVLVIPAWTGKLRVGIAVSLVSETNDEITYNIKVSPEVYQYQGIPHHYFEVTVDGVSIIEPPQSDDYMANTPAYPGDGRWYASTSEISGYDGNITFPKGNAQRSVVVAAALGTEQAFEVSGVWVNKAEATHSVSISIPKKKSGMHVNVGGTWKEGQVFVKADGAWKEGQVFTKVNGTWKEGV